VPLNAMWDALKALLKQPLWIMTVVLGTIMVALPCVTIDKDYRWSTHSPSTLWPPAVGIALLLISALSFAYANWADHLSARNAEAGLDLSRVEESKGEMWTTVSGCEIRVVEGRVQDYASAPGTTIVLPCNEYFEVFRRSMRRGHEERAWSVHQPSIRRSDCCVHLACERRMREEAWPTSPATKDQRRECRELWPWSMRAPS
jgi:hypothetical protein